MGSGVSVVISTFNRPQTLRVALRSVATQTQPPEEILVIGDCCNSETKALLDELGLPGLRYINLPERCGEQSIPNAVGTVHARGRYVAFLNHDDVWFPNHLEVALRDLTESGRCWWIGAAFFADSPSMDHDGFGTVEVTDTERTVERSFSRQHFSLEPNSSWVISTKALLDVGNWRPAWSMARTPVSELALRLWRNYGEPYFQTAPTTLKILDAALPGRPTYSGGSPAHDVVLELLDRFPETWPSHLPSPVGIATDRQAPLPDAHGNSGIRRVIAAALVSDWSKKVYSRLGVDPYELFSWLLGSAKGAVLHRALVRRTGEALLPRQTLQHQLELLSSTAKPEA